MAYRVEVKAQPPLKAPLVCGHWHRTLRGARQCAGLLLRTDPAKWSSGKIVGSDGHYGQSHSMKAE